MFGAPNYFLVGVTSKPAPTQKGIFGFGSQIGVVGSYYSYTNIVTSAGVVGTDNGTVATAKTSIAATTYGGDKGIFGFGFISNTTVTNNRNLVSNTGVLTTDASTSGTAKGNLAACGYGKDKGIFGFGFYYTGSTSVSVSTTNLVSNTGIIGSDVSGVTAGKYSPAACRFGLDKGIFGFGSPASGTAVGTTNIVTNAGIMGSDVAAVGTGRNAPAAASYGFDKGIFAYGYTNSAALTITNAISNTGVVLGDVVTSNTARWRAAGCVYGGDKGIIGFGSNGSTGYLLQNLISSTGTFASDTAIVSATVRYGLSACSFSLT